ncbi:MAG: hypothetical protein IPJ65_26655 [Archangiaceae bacterium]|nr:hypothetical protein [Archangiaceae bacterium]
MSALLFTVALVAAQGWDVPAETSRVEVAGETSAAGMPMKLTVATSALKAEALMAHYRRVFAERALYLPPPSAQLEVEGAVQLSALDVEHRLAYQVIARELPGKRGSKLLLSVASLETVGAARPEVTFPGAGAVLRTEGEGSSTFSYAVTAREDEVRAFHAEVLAKAGYRQGAGGAFERAGEAVRVMTKALENGRVAVVVTRVRVAR